MAKEKTKSSAGEDVPAVKKRERVRRGRRKEYLQNQVADALPDMATKAIEKAKSGDVGAFKTLWQMSSLQEEVVRPRVWRRSAAARRLLQESGLRSDGTKK